METDAGCVIERKRLGAVPSSSEWKAIAAPGDNPAMGTARFAPSSWETTETAPGETGTPSAWKNRNPPPNGKKPVPPSEGNPRRCPIVQRMNSRHAQE